MKTTIAVGGMHCSSCEVLIKDALGELKGIKNIEVSHKKGVVIVEFDESEINKNRIKEGIVKEGYKVG